MYRLAVSGCVVMAEKSKASQRDLTLINILGRIADQLQKQDQQLESLTASQIDLSQSLETVELRMKSRLGEVNESVEKLQESFSRYRSDMLSLVNEQDHINKNVTDMNNLVNRASYAVEISNQEFAGLREQINTQEKTVNEHYTHSLKHAEAMPKEIAESTRSITKLHMDTEKSLSDMHRDTQRRLEKTQQDIMNRLLVLSDIESSLQTLKLRTEPHERRPFWFVRLFRRMVGFMRTRST